MAHTTIDELKKNRLAAMTADERAVFDETYEAARLALDVGEKVRHAREAGAVDAKITMLQRLASALDFQLTVELSTVS